MPTTFVALLRGINVGGKNKLPMKDLVDLFTRTGCTEVRTFIQSGNIIFQAEPDDALEIPDRVTAQIAERHRLRVPVILRSVDQLRAVSSGNPFLQAGVSEEILHVMFLANRPDPVRVASLDPNRSAPDAFSVRGQEIYLKFPHGVAETRLSNSYFDSKLATISTGRNWRTVTTLLALMES